MQLNPTYWKGEYIILEFNAIAILLIYTSILAAFHPDGRNLIRQNVRYASYPCALQHCSEMLFHHTD